MVASSKELKDLQVGFELPLRPLPSTQQGFTAFDEANGRALKDRSKPATPPSVGPQGIHSNEDFARSQGLPGTVGTGMRTTGAISSMLLAFFGKSYLVDSRLRTKFIRP